MSNQPKTLYACVHVCEFPAQALLRLRSDLAAEPVVVMEGTPPQEFVCAMNAHALRRGAARGMTRLDAEAIAGLKVLARSRESEAAARMVVMERAAKFSPRIEEVSEGTACAFVLDIAGTDRLFGPPEKLAARLRADMAAAGFRVSIAVSGNFDAARMKAAASRGITVIPDGAEAVALAKLPLSALPLEEDHRETFAIWGIRTLGELAALPEIELITRLGQRARAWREAAWGMLPHMFRPMEPEFVLREFLAFEDAVEEMDSLLFVGARMIDALVERAADRALALARVTVRMKLDGGAGHDLWHELALRPAIPSVDRKFLLKVLQLEIAAHPPQSAVMNLELNAEAAQSSLVQLGLFVPQTPEPSRLDVTLARLKAIVGEDRVGSAVLEDEHRPGSFRMENFRVDANADVRAVQRPRVGLRRMRPAAPVRVWMRAGEPGAFATVEERFEITAAYGPWRTSGSWWSAGEWDLEEWDVLGLRGDGASVACLLVRDCARAEWKLEAMYD
jgi:protein ImuB